jgi:hypothetical protein
MPVQFLQWFARDDKNDCKVWIRSDFGKLLSKWMNTAVAKVIKD